MPSNQTKARHSTALLLLTRALQQQFGGFYLSDMAAVHLEFQSAEDQWNPGELALHRLLRVPTRNNPTAHGLAPHHAARVHENHMLAVGALDGSGQPWTSVWGGEPGFAGPVAPGVLGVRSLVDKRHDPVARALLGHLAEGEILDGASAADAGLPFSALSIDFRNRDRVKLAGRVVAGVMGKPDGGEGGAAAAEESGVGQVQLALAVLEALGNCPKYINLKTIRPHVPRPELVSDSLPLSPRALEILEGADLFFLSSSNGKGQMDTNHRGGAPGLVRVVRNSPGSDGSGGGPEVVLAYPEFSGNRLYQSLGNLHLDPRVGVAVPDFASSDVLYLAGTTRLLVGAESAALLPHTKLAVRIDVTAARLVRDGLPFRGDVVDFSPYNPPARRLADEVAAAGSGGSGSGGVGTATLKTREVLSPTVSRLTFSLRRDDDGTATAAAARPPLPPWGPGQHVTLDFSAELDMGYSHMREEDPQSLNDDYVRTFTVSSPPPADGPPEEFQITVRRHGPATGLLARWNTRVPLELPVLGFGGGGGAGLEIPIGAAGAAATAVFVATGVGITPLLAQAGRILQQQQGDGAGAVASRLWVLWSLRAEDVPFALDSFRRIPGLAGVTRLFVTGKAQDGAQTDELAGLGAAVVQGRFSKNELLAAGLIEGTPRKYYVCTGPEAAKTIAGWLEKEDVVTESFQY
ncbi:hypothetical protein RB595_002919 [Gaeumannomyces hyphopodioides]